MAHGDIKPENVMINNDCKLILIDLGHSNSIGSIQRGTIIGTENYRAPEINKFSSYLIDCTDIYSLGCTMFTILFKTFPFLENRFT